MENCICKNTINKVANIKFFKNKWKIEFNKVAVMRCNFQIMENCTAKMKNKVAITGIQCKKKIKKKPAGIKNNVANVSK